MIYLGTDHAGFELKEELKKYISEDIGLEVKDLGNLKFDKNDDYPDWIFPVAKKVAEEENAQGIILGGSGQGEAMAANRFPGVRAALCYDYNEDIIKLSRTHNNANILSLGARFLTIGEAKKAVKLWLETNFPGDERHERRINKLDKTNA